MDGSQVDAEYLSVGANRQTAAADWHADGTVAFGADSNIALWRPHDVHPKGVTALLSGHKATVKAVTFLPRHGGEETAFLLSGADDQCLKLWEISPSGGAGVCIQTVHEHTAPINCITALKSANKRLFATGAADATVKIWSFEGKQIHLLQTIKTDPKYFPLALALSPLGGTGDSYVLAAAGTRTTIQIFVGSGASGTNDFSLQATLSGHEAWIRSLDFTYEKPEDINSDLLLASASQDKYIRLWRIHQGRDIPVQATTDPSTLGAYLPGRSPSNKAHRLRAGDKDYSITFEALLLGHDDWIYSAKWHTGATGEKHQLLSTSADNSLAIWEADPTSGIWITTARLGDISSQKGATTATGSIGGFWTGLWSPSSPSVLTLGRTGSWRRWDYDQAQDQWVPAIAVTGHTKAVTGIAWSRGGEYLLSTSADQTTRLHAEWKAQGTWHEMARPQIHGYDLNCIDALGASQFVSGADEKLMRVFSEPKAVARLLGRLSGIDAGAGRGIEAMPDAANMPVLGLSNKAIEAVDDDAELPAAANPETDRDAPDPATAFRRSALEIDHPPLEDSLSRHTLWPEAEKLYGHGYGISCLAVSHDGKLVASACKASSVNHAVIRLFETERWTEVKPPLTAHSLTATRLRFSHDDRYLLSVGRDRQWAVFERSNEDGNRYSPMQANAKGHTRMILDCAWALTAEDRRVFATAGRDKQVKIWAMKPGQEESKFELGLSIPQEHPVTAVDFLWRPENLMDMRLAVGTEAGKLSIISISVDDSKVTSTLVIKPDLCLPRAVLQLSWRPTVHSSDEHYDLAIAGEDSSLRIYRLQRI
ncbi:Elongator protein 2 [Pleurostoma richardsiae]|uniref:Elongator complex protein 2 n=1 Tax=Pleurostoma richardsiae TaxID=41990 RepID=A0AA38RL34_9PEZI|nr:Elongator protein 2 [Pleurostoma richardsiae]